MLYLILPLVGLLLTAIPLVPIARGVVHGKKAKRNLLVNLSGFAGIMVVMIALPLGGYVLAAGQSTVGTILGVGDGLKYLAAALSTGLASLGAGIAVGNAAPAAIGACSEDEKAFGKAMIFVVMGEGIAIYGLIISFLILFS